MLYYEVVASIKQSRTVLERRRTDAFDVIFAFRAQSETTGAMIRKKGCSGFVGKTRTPDQDFQDAF